MYTIVSLRRHTLGSATVLFCCRADTHTHVHRGASLTAVAAGDLRVSHNVMYEDLGVDATVSRVGSEYDTLGQT